MSEELKPAAQIMRETLQASPLDGSTQRVAVVTRDGDNYVATYNGIVVARAKDAMRLHSMLIEKPTTNRALFARIEAIRFDTEVDMPLDAVVASKMLQVLDLVDVLLKELGQADSNATVADSLSQLNALGPELREIIAKKLA